MHPDAHGHRPNAERLVRGRIRGGRRRVECPEEQGHRGDVPPGSRLDRPEERPSRERAEDAETDHVREEVHAGDALPVNPRGRIGDRQDDHQGRHEEEPVVPDECGERADRLGHIVAYDGPGHVRREDEAHRGESERREQERVPFHEALADQLLDHLHVLLTGIHAVRRPHVVVDVHQEREGPEERAHDEDPEDDSQVVDEEVLRGRGLREHPSDVEGRDGDDPELDAAEAHDQLGQVARRDAELLRDSDLAFGAHGLNMQL